MGEVQGGSEAYNREVIYPDKVRPCMQGSCPEVYLEKAFDGTGLRPEERLPVVQALGETRLMFVVHPTLTEADMFRVADIARDVLGEATQ